MDEMDNILTPFARQHGIGLINASPLHMGRAYRASGASLREPRSSLLVVPRIQGRRRGASSLLEPLVCCDHTGEETLKPLVMVLQYY